MAGVKAWARLVRGQTANLEKIKEPLQRGAHGLSSEEFAVVQKLCFGHTHQDEPIEGEAYHPDRFVDDDPEFRGKVHQTFEEIDRVRCSAYFARLCSF